LTIIGSSSNNLSSSVSLLNSEFDPCIVQSSNRLVIRVHILRLNTKIHTGVVLTVQAKLELNMYRVKIRERYDHLSRSYRRVADYILSNYYEVSFMTAAQLAAVVNVDTTTVVRFSQRLGYNGYPDLLANIRAQVKNEIYASYTPQELAPDDPAGLFRDRVEQERRNLSQMSVHNPPDHVALIAAMIEQAERILLVAEGYAGSVAEMAAAQLRHRGIAAVAVEHDLVKRASTLLSVDAETLVIGLSATTYSDDVARSLEFARERGAATLGIVGSLASPVNRVSDQIIYAPTDASGPLPSIVALVAATSILVQIAGKDDAASVEQYQTAFAETYGFLLQRTTEDKL